MRGSGIDSVQLSSDSRGYSQLLSFEADDRVGGEPPIDPPNLLMVLIGTQYERLSEW